MNIQIFPGKVLVSRAPVITQTHSGIVLPSMRTQVAVHAYVHLHEPGPYWDYWGGESPLTGRTVIIEKWAGRPLWLSSGEKRLELWLLPEESILGIQEAE